MGNQVEKMMTKKFNVFDTACPSHKLLDVIGNKWVILILHKLAHKTYRFGELQREIGGISKKVLTSTLQRLEKNHLLVRHDYNEKPLRVEYSLTPLGLSLSTCCYALTQWAEENMGEIERFKSA